MLYSGTERKGHVVAFKSEQDILVVLEVVFDSILFLLVGKAFAGASGFIVGVQVAFLEYLTENLHLRAL